VDERSTAAGEQAAVEERELVARLQRGDRDGLEGLMDRHGEQLLRYLHALLLRREEAEDLFQETWVRVIEQAARFDPARPFAPWLFTIARNLALDRLRWWRRWRFLGLAVGEPAVAGTSVPEPAVPSRVEDGLVSRQLAGKLLEGLDARSREVLWLRFWGDLAYEEIATVCRVPVGTVKSRLARALARVAGRWAEMEEESHVEHEPALS
jgi:RNA polymerase sigma-70 factor, ECF subfamily